MTPKTLKTLTLPVVLGHQVAQDADGTKVIVESYVDAMDGIVKIRVVDPPTAPDRANAGDLVTLQSP